MKITVLLVGLALFVGVSCEKDIRNIAEPDSVSTPVNPVNPSEVSTDVNPVDINDKGFDLLEKMQGHWVGSNFVIAEEFEWFCWDYRAISESHIHGIFEGGSMGNLFTSFFVTDYKGKRTVMARNGGVLSGIYRTSYFVLDSVNYSPDGDFYRLVDANNGTAIMWMELLFRSDSLYFNSYTSRLGEFLPTLHMAFRGKKEHLSLAQSAAGATGFPVNTPTWDFSAGFNESWFYQNPNSEYQSATFMAESQTLDVYALAGLSGDPFTINDHPRIASLDVEVVRNPLIENKPLFMFVSMDPLTDGSGQLVNQSAFNTVLWFPRISETQDEFLFTYLHPGSYYLTIVADVNEDGIVSQGDVTHVSQQISLAPEENGQITIDNINIQN